MADSYDNIYEKLNSKFVKKLKEIQAINPKKEVNLLKEKLKNIQNSIFQNADAIEELKILPMLQSNSNPQRRNIVIEEVQEKKTNARSSSRKKSRGKREREIGNYSQPKKSKSKNEII